MSLLTRLAAIREYAYEAVGGKPKVIPGEMMYANPLQRLFGQKKMDVFNPNELLTIRGYRIVDKMLQDDQVKSALHLKKLAICAPGYEILNPEGVEGDYEPTDFIREVFEEMSGTFISTLKDMLTCLDYGYSITEKVWQEDKPIEALGGKKMIVLSALKVRSPRDVIFTTDEFGNILAVKQMMREIPIDKLIIYTHEGRFGNPYGVPDIHAAYRPWWIKDNAYKWMAMLLERMGIPPVFFLYSSAYTPADVEALKAVVLSMQAGTGGAIPRPTKPEDLEPWAPELADNVSQVFIPTIEHLNKSIARGILVPALLGLSDQGSVGALARSETEFKVFMLVIDGIRQYLGQAIIQEQVIEPLIQLNFPAGTEQPRFVWKPLMDEVKSELYSCWTSMVTAGVVTNQPDDEDAIRAKFKMPPLSTDGKAMREKNDEMKEKNAAADLKVKLNPPGAGGPGGKGKFDEDLGDYTLYSAESTHYIDVAATLNELEAEGVERLRSAITDSRDDLIDSLRRKGTIDAKFANEVTLRRWSRVQDAVAEMLRAASEAGVDDASGEMTHVEEHAAKRRGMTPNQLVQYLNQKTIYVSGVLKDSILKDVKNELLNGVKTGATMGAIVDAVTDVFLPWLGDPALDPEVAMPYRTETIVRTNLTDGYNQGRLNRFRDPKMAPFIVGVQYSAILDERTTPVCQHLHGKVFKPNDPALDALAPPNHFNCRSLLVPIMVDQPVKAGDYITPSEVGEAKELKGKGFDIEELDFKPDQARFPKGHPDGGQWKPEGVEGAPKHPANTHTKIRRMIKLGKEADQYTVSKVMKEVITYKKGSFTSEQIDALREYVESSTGLNNALRHRQGDLSKFPSDGTGIKSIRALDKAFTDVKNFALPIKVYRGMPASVYQNLKPGDTFVDHGYQSTTFSKHLAQGWGSGTVEISLPKGFKFISIPSTIEHGIGSSLANKEAEVLLPRSTVYRIKSLGTKGKPTKVEAIASSVQGQPKTMKPKSAPVSTTDPAVPHESEKRDERFIWAPGQIVVIDEIESPFTDDDYSMERFANPNHYPAGSSKGGEFAPKDDSVMTSEDEQLHKDAAAIAAMDQKKRDSTETGDFPGGAPAYLLYEAQTKLPKDSDSLKRVTDSNSFELWQHFDYIARVKNRIYGVSRQEDPDEPDDDKTFVFSYEAIDRYRPKLRMTTTADKGELINILKERSK